MNLKTAAKPRITTDGNGSGGFVESGIFTRAVNWFRPQNPRSSASIRGSSFKSFWPGLLAACLLLPAPTARGDYTLAVVSGGLPSKTVVTGGTFDLDFVLSSDAQDSLDSVVIQLLFSASGLTLLDYVWSEPYQTGGEDDASVPDRAALPVQITAGAAVGSALPPVAVDLFLSNLIGPPGTFGTGRILRLKLAVPAAYVGPEVIRVSVAESGLSNGLTIIRATSSTFELRVEPATGVVQSPLSISQDGRLLSISWPSLIANAVLETSFDPGSSNWVKSTTVPVLLGDRYVAALVPGLDVPYTFFRLRYD